MTGFVERLDEINALADHSQGIVWRLQGEDGDATQIQAITDPLMLVNMSVWESIEIVTLNPQRQSKTEKIVS